MAQAAARSEDEETPHIAPGAEHIDFFTAGERSIHRFRFPVER